MMGFRTRLVLFFVATLAVIQILTAILVYEVTRHAVISVGERDLAASGAAFSRQLDDLSERVAVNVQILALDYALRSAIAQGDRETLLSALRNHGRRVGATRMMLIGVDAAIQADTTSTSELPQTFPYRDLLNNAYQHPAAAVIGEDAGARWFVVVPVLAPSLIAFIAAEIPIDDALLAHMQQLSELPKQIEIVIDGGDGAWSTVAQGGEQIDMLVPAMLADRHMQFEPRLIDVQGREFVALALPLTQSKQSLPVAAVLGYSLDEAMHPYGSVAIAWAILLTLGLCVGLLGALFIARDVSQPVEALAATARRIAAGDYHAPPAARRNDELGELATAFANMASAIGEREERIHVQLDHDAVTGLPNRHAAEATIEHVLAAGPGQASGLLMIGLARLPEIIKTLGHAISDRLMRDAGERIQRSVGVGLVARATDADFLIWMPVAERASAIAVAFRILDALSEPYQEADLSIDLAPAIGIALYPQHGTQASALMQHAEVALFAALGSDDPVVVYDAVRDPHRPERLSLMGDLREALDNDELQLYYQPKLNLIEQRIDGVEALMRWQHAKRGLVATEDFIAFAESTGNIRKLTRWALANSIVQAQQWATRGVDLCISVNLSARDLLDRELPRRLSELMAIHGVAPTQIALEITESAVMGRPDAAIRVLKWLADMGFDLAIDDFGVGQSSFAYLRKLPVREIKIDKSFMQELANDREDQTIVRSIIELGHRLNYRVTAEGVEDQATLDFLIAIGCDHAQGFHIAKAMSPEAIETFITQNRWSALV